MKAKLAKLKAGDKHAFIDRNGSILACDENGRPWRMCSCPGAWAVLERPSILATPPALQQVPA